MCWNKISVRYSDTDVFCCGCLQLQSFHLFVVLCTVNLSDDTTEKRVEAVKSVSVKLIQYETDAVGIYTVLVASEISFCEYLADGNEPIFICSYVTLKMFSKNVQYK